MKTHLQILIGVQFVLQRLEQVVFPYKAWSMWHHVEPKERKPAIYCCAQETHNPMTKFYDYCKKFHYIWSQGESHWLWFINISNTLGVPHCLLWDTVPLGHRLRPTQVFNNLNHPWITLEILSQRVLMRNRVEAKERRSRKAGERVKQTRVSAVKRFLLQHNSLFRFLQRPASIPVIKRNMICQIK